MKFLYLFFAGENEESDDAILQGKFDYLFLSPEALTSDVYRKKLQEFNVVAIVVDEFHTMYTW